MNRNARQQGQHAAVQSDAGSAAFEQRSELRERLTALCEMVRGVPAARTLVDVQCME
ncbi:hypothetical protein [Burkholderia orbicola]|uniref:hypothetical protein n=1 Tax=Burkholderia orbicola TaxID=2978683 RepID=UPI000B233A59|nr:hypothetical protein [Burkholderia orbicola]MDN7778789.1 hypothetical protein [Burkholderia orbicola]